MPSASPREAEAAREIVSTRLPPFCVPPNEQNFDRLQPELSSHS